MQPPSNGLATAGFVCGLIGLLICLIPFGIFFGGILAILGIVFGFVARSRAKTPGIPGRALATAGVVLSIVGLVIGTIWIVAIGRAVKTVNDQVRITQGDIDINQQSCHVDSSGQLIASGELTNKTGDRKVLVTVHVDAKDGSGKVVGFADDFVGTIDAHLTNDYDARGTVDDPNVGEVFCSVSVS
ncbi:MAG TPA: DUF4190 domain-containing protein [Acidimicrobiales bacterium]